MNVCKHLVFGSTSENLAAPSGCHNEPWSVQHASRGGAHMEETLFSVRRAQAYLPPPKKSEAALGEFPREREAAFSLEIMASVRSLSSLIVLPFLLADASLGRLHTSGAELAQASEPIAIQVNYDGKVGKLAALEGTSHAYHNRCSCQFPPSERLRKATCCAKPLPWKRRKHRGSVSFSDMFRREPVHAGRV